MAKQLLAQAVAINKLQKHSKKLQSSPEYSFFLLDLSNENNIIGTKAKMGGSHEKLSYDFSRFLKRIHMHWLKCTNDS